MSIQYAANPLKLGAWLAKRYPTRTFVTVICLLMSGIVETLGLAAMLPLMSFVLGESSGSSTRIGQIVTQAFEAVGVTPTVGTLLVFIVIVLWLKSILIMVAANQVGYSATEITRRLRLDLLGAMLRARWRYFTEQKMGNLTAALTSEANKASSACLQLVQIVSNLVQVLSYLLLSFLVSWWASAAALAIGVVLMMLLSGFIRISRAAGAAHTTLMRNFTSRVIDGLQAIKPIKSMGREADLIPLLENDVNGLSDAQRRSIFSREALRAMAEPLSVLAVAIGLYALLSKWSGSIEALFAVVFLFYRTVNRISTLQRSYQAFARTEPGFWFIHKLLDTTRLDAERTGGERLVVFRQAISLHDVSFAYDKDTFILNSLNLEVNAGEFVTLVGPSGAGKTTTLDLITGLLEPTHGEVLIDGCNLSNLDLQHWRSCIGYVPQETVLFHDTIMANVTLGDSTFSRADAEQALKRAEADEFVSASKDGLDTIVGEKGLKISGGQRQRIAIARALIRNPKLLVLDEATTSLDPATERDLCATLLRLKGAITILAISHQPALVEIADRVYEIADGVSAPTVGGSDNNPVGTNRGLLA